MEQPVHLVLVNIPAVYSYRYSLKLILKTVHEGRFDEASAKSGCHIMNYLETGELSLLMLEKKLNYFEFHLTPSKSTFFSISIIL